MHLLAVIASMLGTCFLLVTGQLIAHREAQKNEDDNCNTAHLDGLSQITLGHEKFSYTLYF